MAVFERDFLTGGRDFSSVDKVDNDLIRRKNVVKNILLGDSDLLHFLNNAELEEEMDPESYFRNNVLDYLYVNPDYMRTNQLQNIRKNFVCYEIDDISNPYNTGKIANRSMKNQILTVECIVHRDEVETAEGLNRLDVLAYIIQDLFAWSNALEMQISMYSNIFEVIDSYYYCRTLKFRMEAPNNINNGRRNTNEQL